MKRGFSMVEMIVVIAIIGILAAVMLGTFSGSTDSARGAKCLGNMRTLAAAAQSYAMVHGFYPTAGSLESYTINTSGHNRRNVKEVFGEIPGWVSWYSQGAYASKPSSSKAQSGWVLSTYETDDEARRYCITNGALWKYVSGNRDVYRCASHVIKNVAEKEPNWSYLMNPEFGWTSQPGSQFFQGDDGRVWYNGFDRSDRYLLFAEMPFTDYAGVEIKTSTSAGQECDCVLQFKTCDGASTVETIGFNHKVGKNIFAHVVYADGHAEKLNWPKDGLDAQKQQNLTKWLCKGIDVSFDGKNYNNLTKDQN